MKVVTEKTAYSKSLLFALGYDVRRRSCNKDRMNDLFLITGNGSREMVRRKFFPLFVKKNHSLVFMGVDINVNNNSL